MYEFKKWYASEPDMTNGTSNDVESNGIPDSEEGEDDVATKALNLSYVRNITKLSAYDANEVYEIFSEMSPSGSLNEENFVKCFNRIIKLGGGHDSEEDKNNADAVIRKLFQAFDSNNNGVVDSRELASGISVLCSGSQDDKIQAAFALYDLNNDGFITLYEMTRYLTSVFRVLYETNRNTESQIGVPADELGKITAEQAFIDCDLNHDGRLSYNEFKKWYLESGGGF